MARRTRKTARKSTTRRRTYSRPTSRRRAPSRRRSSSVQTVRVILEPANTNAAPVNSGNVVPIFPSSKKARF